MTISPGTYLRKRREAAGLSIDELALMLETYPVAVSARSRAELIALIESDAAPIGSDVVLAYSDLNRKSVIDLDPSVLAILILLHSGLGEPGNAPQLCRICACSFYDPCVDEHGIGCAWAAPDLCTACVGPAESAAAATETLGSAAA